MNSLIFGVMLTVIVYNISLYINKKTKLAILNPIALSMIFIIAVLRIFNITYDEYNEGAKIISFFVGPATLALVIPLYKNIHLLKKNFIPIIIGIAIGSLVGLISTIILSKLLNVDEVLLFSLLPKSTTSTIAADISNNIGGESSITLVFVTVVGVFGNIFAPKILDLLNIKSDVAKGISIGTASHVVGTAKAVELSEEIGAMSSLAITLAGIITVFLIPVVLYFFF